MIGSVYGYRYDNEKSLEYFEKANLLFMEIDDKKGLNQVKMNEAYVYASMLIVTGLVWSRFRDLASPSLNCSGRTPIPMRLLLWILS